MAMPLNGTIHVIDDDPTVRDSLALLLTFLGYPTRSWSSGGQFLAEQSLGPRDIVLVDLIMPGDDGLAVIRALRDKNLFNPVILMTGDSGPALENKNIADHCTLLSKPFSKDGVRRVRATTSAAPDRPWRQIERVFEQQMSFWVSSFSVSLSPKPFFWQDNKGAYGCK